jgi:hypothetical protein
VHKYETNQVIKALGTWLCLKHETSAGIIQQWNEQKERLLQLCKCSDSIFRHRLQLLEEMKLISFSKIERKRDTINICSWHQLAKVLDIDIKQKFIIKYNIHDKQKLHEWIIATEIKDNQNRQDFSIIRKLRVNAESKMIIDAELLRHGADNKRLNEPEYYLARLRMLYINDFFQLSEAHNELLEIRPDNNRSVRGIANAWNAKHAMTASYWKKILSKSRIIDVAKCQVKSQERARNKHCKVLWIKQDKQTLLCMCDQVNILQPWLISDEFKIKFAA